MLRKPLIAAVVAAALLGVGAASPAASPAARTAQSRRAQSVILVSFDAFRADFFNRPGAKHLRELAARGVRVERLIPSFPSKTYPNHLSIVTGRYPVSHGIIANTMRDATLGRYATGKDPSAKDGRWYQAEPIWIAAERQGVHTAVSMWPGDEAEIGGVRPREYAPYDSTVPHATRVQWILDRLAQPEATAPRFFTLYFETVDDVAHKAGPASARTDSAIAVVDSVVGALMAGIERLGRANDVNLIFVSDHGMAPTGPDRVICLDDYVSLDSVDVIDMNPVANIAPKPGREAYAYAKLKGAHPHLQVYRKAEIPERWHYRNNDRIAAILAVADEGWTITTRAALAKTDWSRNGGAHGYDNALPSMGALFVAAGPAFKRGVTLPPVQNVHVYPLIAHLLGIVPAPSDGSLDSLRAALR